MQKRRILVSVGLLVFGAIFTAAILYYSVSVRSSSFKARDASPDAIADARPQSSHGSNSLRGHESQGGQVIRSADGRGSWLALGLLSGSAAKNEDKRDRLAELQRVIERDNKLAADIPVLGGAVGGAGAAALYAGVGSAALGAAAAAQEKPARAASPD